MAAFSRTGQALGLFGWGALTFAAAAMGAKASLGAPTFYQQLSLPLWAPPGWLFGPVWTVLYVWMALAVWGVWRERGTAHAKLPLGLYVLQLGANALWSWLFFVFRRGGWAFADILVLGALILATLITFWRVRRWTGLLLLPYLAWVTFAACLNAVAWIRNPQLLT